MLAALDDLPSVHDASSDEINTSLYPQTHVFKSDFSQSRSEERRVGKEC